MTLQVELLSFAVRVLQVDLYEGNETGMLFLFLCHFDMQAS